MGLFKRLSEHNCIVRSKHQVSGIHGGLWVCFLNNKYMDVTLSLTEKRDVWERRGRGVSEIKVSKIHIWLSQA